jgi:spermidine synthase
MLNQNISNPFSSLVKGRMAVFVSGFSMLMVQVVLLRELSSLFIVNELIVGVFLSFWMLFSGMGAFFARFFRGFQWSFSGFFPFISGVTALLSLWSLYLARHWMAVDGGTPGVSDWLLITAFVTFVFCFPTGMMFTWFSSVLSYQYGERQTERVYISEQWGSLFAGVLFYLVPVVWLNAFSTLTLVVVFNFLVAIFLFAPIKRAINRGLIFIGLLGVIILLVLPQYRMARELIAGGRSMTGTFFSPRGSINFWQDGDKTGYFMGGRFVSATPVPRELEELLHPALMLHPSPRHILLINASPGLVTEALKYEGLKVDFISPDEARLNLEKELLHIEEKDVGRVRFIKADPHRYLKRSVEKSYDVVLLGGGIPYNLASTRFYTGDFFQLIAKNLGRNGFFVTGGIDYSSSWTGPRRDMIMVLEETVSSVFPYLRIWAGNKVFFVASQKEITAGWWDYHQKVFENNRFVKEAFFPSKILESHIVEVQTTVESKVRLNTRVRPVLFQLALRDMSDFWDIKLSWFALVIGVLLVSGLLFFRESSRGVFLSGIVLGGMQVILLLYWQLVVGNLFRATGLLFSLFMGGLAIGALLGHREIGFFKARYFPALLIGLSVLSVLSIPFLDVMGHSWFFPLAVFFLVLAFAVLGGAVFVAGLTLHKGNYQQSAALIYFGDVAGGAIGSFLAAIFLVPFAGLVNAGYLLGMAVLIAGLLMLKRF